MARPKPDCVTAHSPALRLLAAACNWPARAQSDAALNAAAEGFEDWSALLRLADRHRVAGLAHQALVRAAIAMPDAIRAELGQAAGAVAFKSMACTAETVRLQQLLDEAGVPVVFFKGVTLGARVYGSLTVKFGKDVDCLVATEDAERCVALLAEHGYRMFRPRDALSPRQWRSLLRLDKEYSLYSAKTGVEVEVHWRLTSVSGLLPTAPLAAAAVRGGDVIAGRPITALAGDDLFAYLCAHGAESGWSRLKWLADLNGLTAGAEKDELDRLYRHAAVRGAGGAAVVALILCGDWFGRAVPSSVNAAFARSPILRAMHAIATTNLRHADAALPWYRDAAMYLLLAAAHGGLGRQLARSTIAIDDAMRFPLPRALYFLYPLLRVPFAIRRKLAARRPLPRSVATEPVSLSS